MINFSNITGQNATVDLVRFINTELTGGFFIILALLAIFVILFINLSYYNINAAFLVAGFIANIITGLLWMAQLVPLYVLIISLVLPFAGVLMVYFNR